MTTEVTTDATAAAFVDLTYEVSDPVAVITLNRPDKLNAFTYETLAELRSATSLAAADPRVVGIVITGAGRGFCAGLDSGGLTDAAEAGSAGRPELSDGELPGFFSFLLSVPKPVIAAVNGVAAGGGLVLAAMSDLRFASQEAWFTTVFAKRGLIAEHGSSWILPRLIGAGAALDLLWSSRRVDAAEAFRLGLVERVVEPQELLATARQYIVDLAESASPASLADTKRLVYRHLGADYTTALRESDEAQWRSLDRPDAVEGARSLVERRPPSFDRVSNGGPVSSAQAD